MEPFRQKGCVYRFKIITRNNLIAMMLFLKSNLCIGNTGSNNALEKKRVNLKKIKHTQKPI